jgi:hypothetical protein
LAAGADYVGLDDYKKISGWTDVDNYQLAVIRCPLGSVFRT